MNNLHTENQILTAYYVCGPTIYTRLHIGNYRTYVTADLIAKVYQIPLYIGITDIADKITTKILDNESISVAKLEFLKGLELCKVSAVILPASERINDIFMLINKLESENYIIHTPYDTRLKLGTCEHYALWRLNKPINFASPYGSGIPGWHIECVANIAHIRKIHGVNNYILHGGGVDLKNTHHCYEKIIFDIFNYNVKWLHSQMVTTKNLKMSKSKNNCIFLEDVKPECLRYVYLVSDYHKVLELNTLVLQQRYKEYSRIISMLYCLQYLDNVILKRATLTYSKAELIQSGAILRRILSLPSSIAAAELYAVNSMYSVIPEQHFVFNNDIAKKLSQYNVAKNNKQYTHCDIIRALLLQRYNLMYNGKTLIYVLA